MASNLYYIVLHIVSRFDLKVAGAEQNVRPGTLETTGLLSRCSLEVSATDPNMQALHFRRMMKVCQRKSALLRGTKSINQSIVH